MTKKNTDGTNTNKIVMIIITLGLIVFLGIIFSGGKGNGNIVGVEEGQNVEVKDGVQYIKIDAKGGYTPRFSKAEAGIPTKLLVETNGTFDCSASLVIRKADFQQILPQTGETEIDLGIPKVGDNFQGLCGMGMYSFEIEFS